MMSGIDIRFDVSLRRFAVHLAALLGLAVLLHASIGVAQVEQRSRGECSPNINGQNNTVNCPVVRHNGECPPRYIYSRTHGECIPIQNYGGVIPCSPDDKRFVPGRGWISNC